MTPKFHSAKDTTWTNAAGDPVPVKHISRSEKLKEATAARLYKKALKVQEALLDLFADMQAANMEIDAALRKDYELKTGQQKKAGKGGLTWYNFDASVKVETNVNEYLKFDDGLMKEAQVLLNEYIGSRLNEDQKLIAAIAADAFSTSKGSFDPRKVFNLLKYEGQVKSTRFSKVCELIRNAQRIDKAKAYYRISVRQADGSYQPIKLNFSSL
jgi:hypothetical protein